MQTELYAIASPVRRAMLRFIWDRERSSSEIADHLGLSRPVASQQLKVLRDAGLVAVRAEATRRLYTVRVESVAELRAFLEDFWGDKLADLRRVAEARAEQRDRGEPQP